MADLKTKHLLLGQPPPCNHAGFIVPMILIPHVVELPPTAEKPAEPKKKGLFGKEEPAAPKAPNAVMFYRTAEASCVKCGIIFKFGMAPAPGDTPVSPDAKAPVAATEPQLGQKA